MRTFSVKSWVIKKIDGNMVTIEELLLPDQDGSIVILDPHVEWVIREQLEDASLWRWKQRERQLIDKAISAFLSARTPISMEGEQCPR